MKKLMSAGLFIMAFVYALFPQDSFNKIRGSYTLSQMKLGASLGDPEISIAFFPPEKINAQAVSIDAVWAYLQPGLPLPSAERPKNICFVVDVSSSMNGDMDKTLKGKKRIDWLKAVCRGLINAMGEQDYLSLVIFANKPRIVFEPCRISDAQVRQQCVSAVDTIQLGDARVGNDTYIAKALREGYARVEKGYADYIEENEKSDTPKYINRVILLTDGHTTVADNARDKYAAKVQDKKEAAEYIQNAASRGIATVSTIALSWEADKTYMDDIAESGGGISLSVDRYQNPQDFQDKLEVLMTSDTQEIQDAVNRLFDEAVWDVSVTLSLKRGVSLKHAAPEPDAPAPSAPGAVSYTFELSYAQQYKTIEIAVELNEKNMRNQEIMSFTIANKDRSPENRPAPFAPYRQTYTIALNQPAYNTVTMRVILKDF